MAWHCNKCNQSGEKFDGCAISECEMVYTTGDEPAAIAELRKRVAFAKERNEQFPTLGNNSVGVFLTNILQEYDELMLTVKACRGTQMDDAGIRQVQEMSEVVNAAIKWWWAQEKSDGEYWTAEQELSATVGKYCVRNKL